MEEHQEHLIVLYTHRPAFCLWHCPSLFPAGRPHGDSTCPTEQSPASALNEKVSWFLGVSPRVSKELLLQEDQVLYDHGWLLALRILA